jgi:membrane associated rhomboid family serine protease
MLLAPYQVDVPMSRWPIANFVIIGLTSLMFLAMVGGSMTLEDIQALALMRGNPAGLIGHTLVHGGWLHLIGNMLFLWCFGNAVCAKVGNVAYPLVYVLLGAIAGYFHMVIDGRPAIGASGAINGIVGMYLVFYPQNDVSCFWWIIFRAGTFSISSMWMILLWLAFDIWGAADGTGNVAYWAHLAGFFSGFGIASLILHAGWVEMRETERSIYDWLAGR